MKKLLLGIALCMCIIIGCPVTAYAGLLNYEMPEGVDGVPVDIRNATEDIGKEYNICPELLQAIAYQESRFQEDAVNGSHYGLCQISVKTHAKRIKSYGWTSDDMLDYYRNLTIAADYLQELFEEYEDVGLVLSVYSGNWKSIQEFERTGKLCSYANSVLEKSYELEDLHEKHLLFIKETKETQ